MLAFLFTMLSLVAHAGKITIPVDVGVGPAVYFVTGPVQQDQIVHFGLAFSVQAIIDKKTIRANKKRIPKQYRAMAMRMEEARISPSVFIPDQLIVSPKWKNTGMYGIGFRPLSVGLPLVRKPVRFSISAGLRLTYVYAHSTSLPGNGNTHFIRPGIDVTPELEIPFSKKFLISTGWTSQVYIPQRIGAGVFEVSPFNETMWHLGQAFLKFHIRFPYKVRL